MSALLIGGLLEMGKSVIGSLFPDPKEAAAAELELRHIAQKGDLAELQAHVTSLSGQLEINKEEAKSGSMFVAGWRPAVGWVGAIGLFVAFIPKSLAMTALWGIQAWVMMDGCIDSTACDIATYQLPPFPDLGVTDLIGILGGILGIGGMRSFDKLKRTNTQTIGGK